MNRTAIATALLLASTGLVVAHSPNSNADCSQLAGDATLVTQDVGGTIYYATASGVFKEDNGVAGLQSHSHECTVKAGKNSYVTTWPADTRVL